MAGYPSTTGGLGGLGGIPMPQEERGFGRQDIGDMLQAGFPIVGKGARNRRPIGRLSQAFLAWLGCRRIRLSLWRAIQQRQQRRWAS